MPAQTTRERARRAVATPGAEFTIVAPPPPCATPDTTSLRGPANASSGTEYVVRWDPIPGAVSYELQESNSPEFAAASLLPLAETEHAFRHSNDVSTGVAFYYYRVRGVSGCNGGDRGFYSSPIAIAVLPAQQTVTVGATPVENPQPTQYQLHICTAAGPNCAFVGGVGQSHTKGGMPAIFL